MRGLRGSLLGDPIIAQLYGDDEVMVVMNIEGPISVVSQSIWQYTTAVPGIVILGVFAGVFALVLAPVALAGVGTIVGGSGVVVTGISGGVSAAGGVVGTASIAGIGAITAGLGVGGTGLAGIVSLGGVSLTIVAGTTSIVAGLTVVASFTVAGLGIDAAVRAGGGTISVNYQIQDPPILYDVGIPSVKPPVSAPPVRIARL